MSIYNAKIIESTLTFDDLNQLCVKIDLSCEGASSPIELEFMMTSNLDIMRFVQLMIYAGTFDLKELYKKIIRIVVHNDRFYGFGHQHEDKFIPTFIDDFIEVNKEQFGELLTEYLTP